MSLPSTPQRVPNNTAESVNSTIRERTRASVADSAARGSASIDQRLYRLDREWDVERTLEANAASVALVGLGLGFIFHRRFFAIPAIVAGFLLQHAVQGWCPPVPIFRRLGVRTAREIDEERYALKALRGDFNGIRVDAAADVDSALAAARC